MTSLLFDLLPVAIARCYIFGKPMEFRVYHNNFQTSIPHRFRVIPIAHFVTDTRVTIRWHIHVRKREQSTVDILAISLDAMIDDNDAMNLYFVC